MTLQQIYDRFTPEQRTEFDLSVQIGDEFFPVVSFYSSGKDNDILDENSPIVIIER